VLGLGLGAGFMAVVHEVCRWDRERRRLAGELAAAAAVPAGRHHRGDTLDALAEGWQAGLAAREVTPVTAYPAGHGWQRPSAMVPPGELLPRPLPVWDGNGQKTGAVA